MTTILFVGETSDNSDKWIIDLLKKKYTVLLCDLGKEMRPDLVKISDIVINRLYTSVSSRRDKSTINKALRILNLAHKLNKIVINSLKGYLFDLDRIKQYSFFHAHRIPYVQTFKSDHFLKENILSLLPLVVKENPSGRNKNIRIINSLDDFFSLRLKGNKYIFQSLIQGKICYRTEFIDKKTISFSQNVFTNSSNISFNIVPRVHACPLSNLYVKKIQKALTEMNIQVFSIEYFMIKTRPIIVDFNLTSNYKSFIINSPKHELESAWIGLIKKYECAEIS